MRTERYIGLISGTSMDAIDAVVVEFSATGCAILAARATHYDAALGRQLRDIAAQPGDVSLAQLGSLHVAVAHQFAAATNAVMHTAGIDASTVTAIGSHGQTLLHGIDAEPPFSLQLGDPGTLAALTGITVVADFRNADIALGGQGAPLVPAFHAWAFGDRNEARAVVNIGGIANITRLAPGTNPDGFDTGPGNGLMDQWCREQRGEPFDDEGAWAASGRVDTALLDVMLGDPYFARPPPKSTGSDYFNLAWLHDKCALHGAAVSARDIQATLCQLTARTVADTVSECDTVAVCGGGAANRNLMDRLSALLPTCRVSTTAAWGIDPDWVEAIAFAWLARQRLRGEPGNIPAVTGARAAVSLGGVYLPPA